MATQREEQALARANKRARNAKQELDCATETIDELEARSKWAMARRAGGALAMGQLAEVGPSVGGVKVSVPLLGGLVGVGMGVMGVGTSVDSGAASRAAVDVLEAGLIGTLFSASARNSFISPAAAPVSGGGNRSANTNR